ncbi:MAG: hypothetical protein ACOX6U_07035 [Oscillospiraceae bacterium]|jgi:hypothetical protein
MNPVHRRRFLLGFAVLAFFLFSGCRFAGQVLSEITGASAENQTFAVGTYGIDVSVPQGWEDTGAENFDLQLFHSSIGMYMSVYGYTDDEFDPGTSPEEVFERQNSSILTLREQVQELKDLQIEEYEDKTVYTILYSAEKDGNQNYYRVYLLDFKSSDKMAWILFTAMPADMIAHSNTTSEIVANVTASGEATSF